MWLNSDTLEKHVTNIYCHLKFCVWNQDMPCALEKTIVAEKSGLINNLVNVIIVFHDVRSVFYTVTIIQPKAGMLRKVVTVSQRENLALFTVTSIHSTRKSKKQKLKQNKMKSGRRCKAAQGSNRSKRQRNRVDK